MAQQIDWTIQDIWNDTMLEIQQPVKARDYIRASEIGTSMLDRYYKMTGVQPTNPFETRVLRIFEAGNLFEWLVRVVLIRSGLLVSSQKEVRIKDDTHFDVVGHLDFIGGGKPDFTEAAKVVKQLQDLYFPTRMLKIADKLIDSLNEKFPNGLPHIVYEVKSVNSMVFWRKNRALTKPYDHHVQQLYTYIKGMDLPEGRILYINKDDLTLAEFSVIPDEIMEAKWQADVQKITGYLKRNEKPPVDSYIVWNPDNQNYEVNWMVARSGYFKLITGIEDKETWTDDMKKLASRANYRVKKVLEKKADATDEQIRYVCDPYIKNELAGKMTIGKEVSINEASLE